MISSSGDSTSISLLIFEAILSSPWSPITWSSGSLSRIVSFVIEILLLAVFFLRSEISNISSVVASIYDKIHSIDNVNINPNGAIQLVNSSQVTNEVIKLRPQWISGEIWIELILGIIKRKDLFVPF